MGFWEDLKKKTTQAVNNVSNTAQNAYNTAQNAYNTAQNTAQNAVSAGKSAVNNMVQTGQNVIDRTNNVLGVASDGVKDVYNATTGAVNKAANDVYNAATGKEPEIDMVAEYDNYLASTAPSTTPNAPTTNGSTTSNAPQFSSEYTAQVDNIMNQIMNREKFSYDMNADAMYQQYKDQYMQQANLANQNAQAQNAALTGGYGSSYGQMVGQQAYAQQMQGLNDIGMELYNNALNQYIREGEQLNNQYAMLADREAQDYNRYLDERNYNYQLGRDAVDDKRYEAEWTASEEQRGLDNAYRDSVFEYEQGRDAINDARYNAEWAASEEQRGLDNTYRDSVFKYEQGRDAINDTRYEKEWAASEEQRKLDNTYRDFVTEYERERDAINDDRYEKEWAASEDQRAIDNKFRQDEFDRETEWYNDAMEEANSNTEYVGSGGFLGENATVPKQLAGVTGLTTTNTNLFDNNGNFMKAAVVSGKDEAGNALQGNPIAGKGTMTYNIGGKEVTLQTGTNPYTNTVNPDAKNGVFSNGYQPNNINGKTLTKTGATDVINGVEQNVWKTPDGKKWVWDGANNTYLPYDDGTGTTGAPVVSSSGSRLEQTTL